MNAGDSPQARSARSPFPDFPHRLAGPSIVAIAFVALTFWTWRRCGDLLQDFGHQLYVPWQLSQGAELYRDIVWLYGPLSQYTNSVIFTLFGVGLGRLLVFNLALLAILTSLTYAIVIRASDRLSATVACLALLILFGFGHFLEEGNFNFVFPYAHEATHGTALLALSFYCYLRFAEHHALRSLLLAGLASGLTFLTKPELSLCALGLTSAFVLIRREARSISTLATLAFGLAAPFVISLFLFSRSQPFGEALRSAAGAFAPLFTDWALLRSAFHAQTIGFDDVAGNVRQTAIMSLLCILVSVAVIALDRLSSKLSRPRPAIIGLSCAIFAGLFMAPGIPWFDLPRGFLLLSLFLLPMVGRITPTSSCSRVIAILWITVAALAALRLGLRVRVFHYGFFLALPLCVGMIPLLTFGLPQYLRAHGSTGLLCRWVFVAMISAFLAVHVRFSAFYYEQRTVAVGSGDDLFFGFNEHFAPDSAVSYELLRKLDALREADSNFFVIPSGTAINYLLRVKNPAPYAWLGIDVINALSDERIREDLAAARPSLVAIVGSKGRGFSFGLPADDPSAGENTKQYLRTHYRTIEKIERDDSSISIELLGRLERP